MVEVTRVVKVVEVTRVVEVVEVTRAVEVVFRKKLIVPPFPPWTQPIP